MDNWWVYIVEKKTGLYVGITTDLENRMSNTDSGSHYTMKDPFRKLMRSNERERSKVGVEGKNWS